MKDFVAWFVLALGILFCGGVSIIQLLLYMGGRGPGALALFVIAAILTAGLVGVAALRIWRGKKFWE